MNSTRGGAASPSNKESGKHLKQSKNTEQQLLNRDLLMHFHEPPPKDEFQVSGLGIQNKVQKKPSGLA